MRSRYPKLDRPGLALHTACGLIFAVIYGCGRDSVVNEAANEPQAERPLSPSSELAQPAVPSSVGGATSDPHAQRHQDYSRQTVHLLGSVDGLRLARDHELSELEKQFLDNAIRDGGELLERHGAFPPHPAAWESPERIDGWQEAMRPVQAAWEAAKQARDESRFEDAAVALDQMRATHLAAQPASGYPVGTGEFLEMRAIVKTIREMDPTCRARCALAVAAQLAERRDRFVAAREPLIAVADRPQFHKDVETLHEIMLTIVNSIEAIKMDDVLEMHRQFDRFDSPK